MARQTAVLISQKEYDALNHLAAYVGSMPIKENTLLDKLMKQIDAARKTTKRAASHG